MLHGPAADQVLLEERFTPGQPVQTLWPLADHLGTARVILDGAGLVLSRLTYDSFGNLVNVPAIVADLHLHRSRLRRRRERKSKLLEIDFAVSRVSIVAVCESWYDNTVH